YPAQAGAHFARCTELLTGELARHPCGLQILPAITCRAWLAVTLADPGQFDRAVALGREALRLADELDHSSSGSIAYWCVGRVYQAKGDDASATPIFQRSLELAQEGNFKIMMPLVAVSLGLQHANAGRALDGLAQLEGGLHVFEPGNALHPYAMQNLGLVYRLPGPPPDRPSPSAEGLTRRPRA